MPSKNAIKATSAKSAVAYVAELKQMLDDAGFLQTEIHRKKPMYATVLGVKP